MQQQDLFFGRHAGEVGLVVASGVERAVERRCRIPQHVAVRRIGQRHRGNRLRKILENFRKQRIVEMHADGLSSILSAESMQAQRNACVVKVGIEARGPLERSDIELVRILKGYFRLVGIGLVMAPGFR